MTWGYLGTIVEWERVGMVVGLRNIVYCIPIQDCKDGSYFFYQEFLVTNFVSIFRGLGPSDG